MQQLPEPDFPRFGDQTEALIICPNPAMLNELSPLLKTYLPQVALRDLRYYPDASQVRTMATTARLCFLDTVSDREAAVTVMGELLASNPNLAVINLLSGNDPDFILRGLRLGASDFLLRPFTGEHIEAALAKVSRTQHVDGAERKEGGKIICVMPAKGACGASTIASNLAYQWKRLGAKRILLSDMDPLTGILSFLLKIKPNGYSFIDVLHNAQKLDIDLWKGMITTRQGVDVLLAPETLVEGMNDLRDPGPIVEFARNNYDAVILDASGAYGDWNLNQARLADEIVLVTTNELPALQAAQRSLTYLDDNRIGRWKIRLVVNRYHRDVGLSPEVIGQALHTEVFHMIPTDYEAVQKGLMDGRPIPATTPFGKNLTALADKLSGKEKNSAKPKSGGFSGLLSMFKS